MGYKEKLNQITTFIFDVDGVLTNGQVYILDNEKVRSINSRDGFALRYSSKMGYNIFVITGGDSKSLKNHLLDNGVKEVILKSSKKIDAYNDLKLRYNFQDSEVLYMGDDLPDYQVLKQVGLSACPQDAAVEIKQISDYQSSYNGGRHCVRDVIEQVLRVQGKWNFIQI